MIWVGDYVAAASFKPGNTVYWTEMCSVPFQNFMVTYQEFCSHLKV